MTDKSVWDKEIPVPAELIEYVDQGVIEKLPPGTQIEGISPSGASYWARTAKIDATDKDGNPTPFFIKVHQFDHGKDMVSAEYHAMSLLYSVVPEMVAEPLAWGAYTGHPDTYFFVCRFHELSDGIPNVKEFPKLVAEFHKRSKATGRQFGFPITTYGGKNPQMFPLSDTWEECFSRGLEKIFDMEEQTHGPDPEMRELRHGLMTKVIPRLLRPMETEGRTLTPTLVHGDLWDGNASVDVNTGHPMFFDATPLYAHNEYELGPWWPLRHKMTHAYIAEYKRHYAPSEPVEDFASRGALYALRFDLHASSLYPGNLRHRLLVMETMRDLLKKYPLGYEGYLLEKGLSPAAANAAAFQANRGVEVAGFQAPNTAGEVQPGGTLGIDGAERSQVKETSQAGQSAVQS